MAGLFESRRRKGEPKGRDGDRHIGFWATAEEAEQIRQLAERSGHETISDYLRALLRRDVQANDES